MDPYKVVSPVIQIEVHLNTSLVTDDSAHPTCFLGRMDLSVNHSYFIYLEISDQVELVHVNLAYLLKIVTGHECI